MFLMTAAHQMKIFTKNPYMNLTKPQEQIILWKITKKVKLKISKHRHINLKMSTKCFQDKKRMKSLREYT